MLAVKRKSCPGRLKPVGHSEKICLASFFFQTLITKMYHYSCYLRIDLMKFNNRSLSCAFYTPPIEYRVVIIVAWNRTILIPISDSCKSGQPKSSRVLSNSSFQYQTFLLKSLALYTNQKNWLQRQTYYMVRVIWDQQAPVVQRGVLSNAPNAMITYGTCQGQPKEQLK